MSSEPPIVITSGSVTIEFDPGTFKQKGDGRFYHPRKKIRRIEIYGEGINVVQDVIPGGSVTIKVHYSSD